MQERGAAPGLLAQHHEHGPLDVVAVLQRGFGLGADGPRGGYPQSRSPENERQIRPYRGILMREHDDLEAVVGHVFGEIAIAVDHAAPEVGVSALHGQSSLAVRVPMWKQRREQPSVPCQKHLGEFVIVYCVCVWWVRNPQVRIESLSTRVRGRNRGATVDYTRWAPNEPSLFDRGEALHAE